MAKTISQLKKELAAKEQQLERLQVKRQTLLSQLEQTDKEIARLEGTKTRGGARTKSTGRGRPKGRKTAGKQSLADVLVDTLKDKGAVKVADAAKMAIEAGYKTASKQFSNVVSQTMTTDKRFRKISRGKYKVDPKKLETVPEPPAKKKANKKTSKK